MIVAVVVGGAINLGMNREYVDGFRKGFGFFAVGAGAGVAATMMPTAVGMQENHKRLYINPTGVEIL